MITSTKDSYGETQVTIFTKSPLSIRIVVTNNETETVKSDVTFYVGDTAVYDSYNLRYLGTITAITEKTVTIDKGRGYSTKARLKHAEFGWRNAGFDLEKIKKENWETSMSI